MERKFKVPFALTVAVILIIALTAGVIADTIGVDFETYTLGNVNGQDGWSMTGPYDVAVVTNSYGFGTFGTQSLRISNAVTSGGFGDQTFAKPLTNAVGETAATAGAFSEGTRQTRFEMQFDIASTQAGVQTGMVISVSPDRGDGSRMSYLRFEDASGGINVFFDDVQQPTPCTPASCANFVETQVGTNLSRATPHTIKLTMDTPNGPSNDVVKVFIDGILVHTGTSWEDYYRYDPEAASEQSPRIVKTVIFRTGGTAVPANAGNGFLIDNLTLSSSCAGIVTNVNTSETFCTIQAAIDDSDTVNGHTISVGPGTYYEDVNVNKSVTLQGAGPASTTIRGVIGGDGTTVKVAASNVTIAGFTITRQGNNTTDWNNPGLNTAGIAVQGTGFTGTLVRDNILTGNRTAIDINNSNGHTIRNNEITFNRTGLLMRNQTDNLTVVENEITDNWTMGILFLDGSNGTNSPVQTALNSTFSNNDISGNWYGQIVDRQSGGSLPAPGTTNLKNFSGNWYGTTSPVVSTANSAEPGYAAQIPVAFGGSAVPPGGQPDILGPASANFDFTPYLSVGTDTDVETTPGRGVFGFQGDFSNLRVTAAGAQNGGTGRVQEGVNAVSGSTVIVMPGTYTENVNVNKSLNLRGSADGGFSAPVAVAPTAATGVWYVDRYRPGVFDAYNFSGEMVLRHGIRGVDVQGNSFYNYQGRKLDTNLTGATQSMTIDIWIDASWNGAQRNAGIWATGFESGPSVSAYPIMAWRSGGVDPAGFYAFDYINGGWLPLMVASAGDYGQWHTLSFALTAGTGMEYFVDGESKLLFPDADTTNLGNVILNAYNFGQDYDVYWDNFMVASDTPATYESVIHGLMTISASNVEVTGLYLTNPGQAYSVLASGALNNIKIANNRIQDLGGTGTTAQIKGVYLPNGADNVTISNNVFDKIVASSTKSADAINFGDSTTTDQNTGVVIEANNISNITAGRGAYGIKLNNGAGVPGVQIKNNTFTGLNGLWSHAVGLETNTLNAVVTGNTFSNLTVTSGTDNAAVWFEVNPSSNTATVTGNKFNGTAFHGVLINAADVGLGRTATAENNWWGTPCGPGPVGPGTGALVGTNVDFSPWWTDVYGGGTMNFAGGAWIVPSGSTTAQTNAIVACAGPGSTVQFATSASPYQGGIVVNNPGVTINLNGQTVGPGSPAFTINADDFTLNGPGTLDGLANASPGILVNGGADNFILNNAQIKNWEDGVEVAGSVTSFKLVNNWIHSNTDAGLQVDSGVSIGGVVTIQGNLFKVNGGNGVQNNGATTNLNVEYNSWGDVGGPIVGVGDGVGGSVDYTPWTFAETYIDVDPIVGDQYQRNVNESTSFNVELKLEAANLYGLAFQFSYDPTYLTFNGPPTFSAPWSGNCTVVGTPPSGTFKYQCFLTSGPAWTGGTVATFNFTANGIALTGNGPWTTYFDISHLETNTNAAAIGGVKVFVNNAGFNAPSTANRGITDTNDGQIDITGIAQFTGFVDLQGRPNDSSAQVSVYNQQTISGATLLASGTSASSGKYTTSYTLSNLLTIGTTYYFQVDRALYLPTTQTYWTAGPPPVLAPTDWAHLKSLNMRPTTPLANVVLLGGDATDDNIVDINDGACIGPAYGGVPVVCNVTGSSDVNGDGVTNILDLVLFGGNYTLSASSWTP